MVCTRVSQRMYLPVFFLFVNQCGVHPPVPPCHICMPIRMYLHTAHLPICLPVYLSECFPVVGLYVSLSACVFARILSSREPIYSAPTSPALPDSRLSDSIGSSTSRSKPLYFDLCERSKKIEEGKEATRERENKKAFRGECSRSGLCRE